MEKEWLQMCDYDVEEMKDRLKRAWRKKMTLK